jgi:hypothetical protein
MKQEVVVTGGGLSLGLAAPAANVSEQDLLMPALDDVWLEVTEGTSVITDKGHDSDASRD